MSKFELNAGKDIFIDPDELRPKGLTGRIMWDIAFCQTTVCRDKDAFMELLEHTAKEIIDRVRTTPHNGRRN